MRKIQKKLAVAVLLLAAAPIFLGGCTFARQRINNPQLPELAAGVEEQKTTREELMEMIGAPSAILPIGADKRVYLYNFGDGKTGGFNLILFGVEKTNLGLDSAYFLIDEKGVVEKKVVSQNSQDLTWDWWPFGE